MGGHAVSAKIGLVGRDIEQVCGKELLGTLTYVIPLSVQVLVDTMLALVIGLAIGRRSGFVRGELNVYLKIPSGRGDTSGKVVRLAQARYSFRRGGRYSSEILT